MVAKVKAWNIFHHFCSLLEEKFAQFSNPLFNTVHITENTIAKDLFDKFKKETIASKDWKGFPTKKGPRNKAKGIPETTKMEKDHESIQTLFNSFWTKFKEEINEMIETGIENWKPESEDESDDELPLVKKEIHLPTVKLEYDPHFQNNDEP